MVLVHKLADRPVEDNAVVRHAVQRLFSGHGSILLLCLSTSHLFHDVAELLLLVLIARLGDGRQDVRQVVLEGGRHVAVLLRLRLIFAQIAWLVDLFDVLFLFVIG